MFRNVATCLLLTYPASSQNVEPLGEDDDLEFVRMLTSNATNMSTSSSDYGFQFCNHTDATSFGSITEKNAAINWIKALPNSKIEVDVWYRTHELCAKTTGHRLEMCNSDKWICKCSPASSCTAHGDSSTTYSNPYQQYFYTGDEFALAVVSSQDPTAYTVKIVRPSTTSAGVAINGTTVAALSVSLSDVNGTALAAAAGAHEFLKASPTDDTNKVKLHITSGNDSYHIQLQSCPNDTCVVGWTSNATLASEFAVEKYPTRDSRYINTTYMDHTIAFHNAANNVHLMLHDYDNTAGEKGNYFLSAAKNTATVLRNQMLFFPIFTNTRTFSYEFVSHTLVSKFETDTEKNAVKAWIEGGAVLKRPLAKFWDNNDYWCAKPEQNGFWDKYWWCKEDTWVRKCPTSKCAPATTTAIPATTREYVKSAGVEKTLIAAHVDDLRTVRIPLPGQTNDPSTFTKYTVATAGAQNVDEVNITASTPLAFHDQERFYAIAHVTADQGRVSLYNHASQAWLVCDPDGTIRWSGGTAATTAPPATTTTGASSSNDTTTTTGAATTTGAETTTAGATTTGGATTTEAPAWHPSSGVHTSIPSEATKWDMFPFPYYAPYPTAPAAPKHHMLGFYAADVGTGMWLTYDKKAVNQHITCAPISSTTDILSTSYEANAIHPERMFYFKVLSTTTTTTSTPAPPPATQSPLPTASLKASGAAKKPQSILVTTAVGAKIKPAQTDDFVSAWMETSNLRIYSGIAFCQVMAMHPNLNEYDDTGYCVLQKVETAASAASASATTTTTAAPAARLLKETGNEGENLEEMQTGSKGELLLDLTRRGPNGELILENGPVYGLEDGKLLESNRRKLQNLCAAPTCSDVAFVFTYKLMSNYESIIQTYQQALAVTGTMAAANDGMTQYLTGYYLAYGPSNIQIGGIAQVGVTNVAAPVAATEVTQAGGGFTAEAGVNRRSWTYGSTARLNVTSTLLLTAFFLTFL